jgi:hypothetical protein
MQENNLFKSLQEEFQNANLKLVSRNINVLPSYIFHTNSVLTYTREEKIEFTIECKSSYDGIQEIFEANKTIHLCVNKLFVKNANWLISFHESKVSKSQNIISIACKYSVIIKLGGVLQ